MFVQCLNSHLDSFSSLISKNKRKIQSFKHSIWLNPKQKYRIRNMNHWLNQKEKKAKWLCLGLNCPKNKTHTPIKLGLIDEQHRLMINRKIFCINIQFQQTKITNHKHICTYWHYTFVVHFFFGHFCCCWCIQFSSNNNKNIIIKRTKIVLIQ